MKIRYKALFFLILIIFLASTSTSGLAVSFPVVRVQPAALQVDSETSFSLSVAVENVVDLYGFDILLEFDPALVQVTSVEMGEFLEQGLYIEFIDNAAGTVQVINSQVNPADPQSGSGTLILVHFIALTETGISVIEFSGSGDYVALSGENGNKIECDLVDGSVEVIGSGEKEEYLVYIPLIMR